MMTYWLKKYTVDDWAVVLGETSNDALRKQMVGAAILGEQTKKGEH